MATGTTHACMVGSAAQFTMHAWYVLPLCHLIMLLHAGCHEPGVVMYV